MCKRRVTPRRWAGEVDVLRQKKVIGSAKRAAGSAPRASALAPACCMCMMHMCNFKGLTRAPSSFDGHLLICPCARLLSRNKFVILTPARWSSCMCPLFAPLCPEAEPVAPPHNKHDD